MTVGHATGGPCTVCMARTRTVLPSSYHRPIALPSVPSSHSTGVLTLAMHDGKIHD